MCFINIILLNKFDKKFRLTLPARSITTASADASLYMSYRTPFSVASEILNRLAPLFLPYYLPFFPYLFPFLSLPCFISPKFSSPGEILPKDFHNRLES